MAETITSAYWQQPNQFQQHILARRETANLDAERNLLGAGQIEDFSRDRIPAGPNMLVSPIARTTRSISTAFTSSIRCRVTGAACFASRSSRVPTPSRRSSGPSTSWTRRSTWAWFDVGVNAATDVGIIRDFRYRQDFGDVGGGRWMPRLISVTGAAAFPIPLIHIPSVSFAYTAALDSFRFNEGAPHPRARASTASSSTTTPIAPTVRRGPIHQRFHRRNPSRTSTATRKTPPRMPRYRWAGHDCAKS